MCQVGDAQKVNVPVEIDTIYFIHEIGDDTALRFIRFSWQVADGDNLAKYELSEERSREIESKLIELIEKEKLFLDCHLTLKQLSQKLGVNRNYISKTLSRSKYRSFYALINSYRLAYAQEMLRHYPTLKIECIAYDSGFSSARVFSQVFKREKGMSPTIFVKTLFFKRLQAN